jgi:hypothetical protein
MLHVYHSSATNVSKVIEKYCVLPWVADSSLVSDKTIVAIFFHFNLDKIFKRKCLKTSWDDLEMILKFKYLKTSWDDLEMKISQDILKNFKTLESSYICWLIFIVKY